MRTKKLMLLMTVAMVALVHRSDGQQARPIVDQLRLAGVMPRGAMVYIQSTDLGALMKTWLASPVRSRFYDSSSFAAFQKSRVYLKLQDRKKDFDNAIGVGLDENRLAELAGRASALSIYDIGKIEMVFVTEVPRARAVASALFKQAPQFQERSADGTSYYVRDVTTDGGRLNQQFCFAYVESRLIVTTTEGLMVRAIANSKAAAADSLRSDVIALAEQAKGFSAHDLTMWLDQTRLNSNRYFDNYWIHHNAKGALANVESALIDLRVAREGMTEQRWFKMGVGGQGSGAGTVSRDDASALMKFAPPDAQLVDVRAAATEPLSSAMEQALFGRLPPESWSPAEIPDHTRKSDNDNTRTERYSRLDSRFDIDVDDEQAPRRGSGGGGNGSGKRSSDESAGTEFAKSIGPILSSVSAAGYCEMVRSKAEAGKPFVRFERAVVVQMKPLADISREALERAITDELRARFVVAGSEARLVWQEEGAVRFVAQTLLEQGAAYSISGNYLVLASSRELAADIIQAAKVSSSPREIDTSLDFYALLRITAAKPVFDTLMSKLDGQTRPSKPRPAKDDEDEREVKFFSDNLSSLIEASGIGEVRLSRQSDPAMTTERIVYLWQL
jgi:hypothetical protein